MPKLQVNADGTVTIPLRGDHDPVTLDEPSMEDLAWLTDEAQRIDDSLPALPTVTDTTDEEQVAVWAKASQERTQAIYSAAMPYGTLLIEAIGRIGPVVVDASQLYGWAASPQVIRALLEQWRAPLPGPASPPNL